jgi:glycosyltransferase involved in cell wall biosynthesis
LSANPFFSVLTVCFNAEGVIGDALASLAKQKNTDWESVIIDGASTDGTLQAIQRVPGVQPRITSEPDGGIYDAMNKGILAARGEVIYFLNADDRFHDPAVLGVVAEAFQACPTVDLLYGNVVYVKPEGFMARSFAHIRRRNLPFLDLNHQAVFARRSLFERVGMFDTRFRVNADHDWLIRVFRSGAKTRHVARKIAFFDAGGRHARDPEFLSRERREVRLQYMSPTMNDIGVFVARITAKWRKVTGVDPRKMKPR